MPGVSNPEKIAFSDQQFRPFNPALDGKRPTTRDDVAELCRIFAEEAQPELVKCALDPHMVQNQCGYYNWTFAVHWTCIGADLEQLYCERTTPFPRHSWTEVADSEMLGRWGHCMAVIGEWYVDWTARQFDVEAPVPLILHRNEVIQAWDIHPDECEQIPFFWWPKDLPKPAENKESSSS